MEPTMQGNNYLIQIDEQVVDKQVSKLSCVLKINDKINQYIIKEINKKK